MPLLDHFRPPLEDAIPWTTLYAGWVTRIADDLNKRWLLQEFIAAEIATTMFRTDNYLTGFEVHIFSKLSGRKLVAVVALISPTNKDRPGERRAFAANSVAYLQQGVSVVVIDIVTSKPFNLHNEVLELLEVPLSAAMPGDQTIYAVSYRPALRESKPVLQLWLEPLVVGQPVPTMPVPLTEDLFVPVEFESTYLETCRRRRLI